MIYQKNTQERLANMATNLFSQWNNANKRINSPSRICKFSQIDHRSRHRNRKQNHSFERLQNSFQADEKPFASSPSAVEDHSMGSEKRCAMSDHLGVLEMKGG
jgi:hypothetical protein